MALALPLFVDADMFRPPRPTLPLPDEAEGGGIEQMDRDGEAPATAGLC